VENYGQADAGVIPGERDIGVFETGSADFQGVVRQSARQVRSAPGGTATAFR
jgi:hypothetical protein